MRARASSTACRSRQCGRYTGVVSGIAAPSSNSAMLAQRNSITSTACCTSSAVPSSSGWPRANTSRPSCGRILQPARQRLRRLQGEQILAQPVRQVGGVLLRWRVGRQQQPRAQQQQPARHHHPVARSRERGGRPGLLQRDGQLVEQVHERQAARSICCARASASSSASGP